MALGGRFVTAVVQAAAKVAVRKLAYAGGSAIGMGGTAAEAGADVAMSMANEVWSTVFGRSPVDRANAEVRTDIEEIIQSDGSALRAESERILDSIAPDLREDQRRAVTEYVAALPDSLRRPLRRTDDPTGTTLPAAFAIRSAADLAALLPPMPRFRAGESPVTGRRLVRLLGVGSFGEVWEAVRTNLTERRVALKFCRGDQRSLEREARLAMQFDHPSIVRLLDVHEPTRDVPICLEYELVDGVDLASWFPGAKHDGPRHAVATRIILELSETLSAAHAFSRNGSRGIVHRDLKPANILVAREGGRLRILDFGIGGMLPGLDPTQATITTGSSGGFDAFAGAHTPGYAPPQQRSGAAPDPRDDVYALGVIWYQLSVGDLFRAPGPDFRDDLLAEGMDTRLIDLVGRCIAHRAETRPANAAELHRLIHESQHSNAGAGAEPIERPRAPVGFLVGTVAAAFIAAIAINAYGVSWWLALPIVVAAAWFAAKRRLDAWNEALIAVDERIDQQASESMLTKLRRGADAGDAGAIVSLGTLMMQGQGVERDIVGAARLYGRAAEKGDALGQLLYGKCLDDGDGVAQDKAEAARWYRAAAEQGNAPAQHNLAVAFLEGDDGAADPAAAVMWFKRAASQGLAIAQFHLGCCYEDGTGVGADKAEAQRWHRKAAEQGHAGSQCRLGVALLEGEGVRKNEEEAVTWLEKAAEQGDRIAQFMVGSCYANGRGVGQLEWTATKWYEKAARQGLCEAQTVMGIRCWKGLGTKKDKEAGRRWLEKASDQGCETASKALKAMDRGVFGDLLDRLVG